jgi:adenylate kinase family enzyme
MRKILIFGNSGSGKSTLASRLANEFNLQHLDLDSLAWLPNQPPQRMPLQDSSTLIDEFIGSNAAWVIEGCYTDLLGLLKADANEMLFLNLPVEACAQNARNRPWEPHKYESKQAQDQNLDMLLAWIAEYEKRDDVFSLQAHQQFYENFTGKKSRIVSNENAKQHEFE